MKFKQPKTVIAALCTLTFFFVSPTIIASNANHHIEEAMKNAETAQIHGKAGHVKTLLEYAQESLVHAKTAEHELAILHQRITESIEHLEKAIARAQQNDSEAATKHTLQALEYLQQSVSE